LAQSLNLSGLAGVDGHLVNITSAVENSFVASLLSVNNAWIGASDSSVEGAWVWDDGPENTLQFWSGAILGSSVNGLYESWDAFEPTSAAGRDFASINTAGDWDAKLGVTTLGYIVEWEANSLVEDTSEIFKNTLNGEAGIDTLYGSDAGVDLFIFDDTSAVDEVYNFNTGNHDQLDLSALLSYDMFNDDISDFINLTQSVGDTMVSVDSDGNANGSNYIDVVNLKDVTGLDLETLVFSENIIV